MKKGYKKKFCQGPREFDDIDVRWKRFGRLRNLFRLHEKKSTLGMIVPDRLGLLTAAALLERDPFPYVMLLFIDSV